MIMSDSMIDFSDNPQLPITQAEYAINTFSPHQMRKDRNVNVQSLVTSPTFPSIDPVTDKQ